jgi:hypothetical protein
MENITEALEPQKIQEPVVPVTIQLTPEEIADLKHKAEVSSQNFERAKKAEDRVRELESRNINNEAPSDEVFSDEGKMIVNKYVDPLKQTISSLEDRLALKDIHASYPVLKDLSSEFEEFRKEYPRHKMENIAKLFLSEKGLLEPKRVGLETSTGGDRKPMTSKMTLEQAKDLREKNPRKYREMLKNGQVDFE